MKKARFSKKMNVITPKRKDSTKAKSAYKTGRKDRDEKQIKRWKSA
jgi:hypothetical protein